MSAYIYAKSKQIINIFIQNIFKVKSFYINLQDSSKFLKWKTRLEIAVGAAQGLSHLHNALDRPLVHRDVKSANILLDNNLTPKVIKYKISFY